MLVLTRKPEESILIGDNFKVTVLEVRGNRVKLGIQGDRNIAVVRGEIHEKEHSEHPSEFWTDTSERHSEIPASV